MIEMALLLEARSLLSAPSFVPSKFSAKCRTRPKRPTLTGILLIDAA